MAEYTKNVGGSKVTMTPEEIEARKAEEDLWSSGAIDRQWSKVRSERVPLLSEADVFVNKAQDLNDASAEEAARIYRQQLRDITTQEDPFNINWPDKPE